MDKLPKWFLITVGVALLLIGGSMAMNAKTNHDKASTKPFDCEPGSALTTEGCD